MDEQRKRVDLLPSTRQRLDRHARRPRGERRRVGDLFRAAGLAPDARSKASPTASSRSIEYYEQILRDWAWDAHRRPGERPGLRAGGGDAGDGHPARPGAGAGRGTLPAGPRPAHPLRRPMTVALDLNPFLLLAARQVLFGRGAEPLRVPLRPHRHRRRQRRPQLRAPGGPPRGLPPRAGRRLHRPLQPGSFDTVVTPWFIDIVPRDIRETIPLIHRLLAPGGRWLNYGPLSYPKEHPHAQRYSYEELYQLIRLGAFELGPTDPHDHRLHALAGLGPGQDRRRDHLRRPPAGDRPRRRRWTRRPGCCWGTCPSPGSRGSTATSRSTPCWATWPGLIDGRRTLEDLGGPDDRGPRRAPRRRAGRHPGRASPALAERPKA